MNQQKLQAGLAPIIIIAIVAVLAIGGGVYYATRDEAPSTNVQENAEDNNPTSSDAAKAKGNIRSLLAIGEDVMCEVKSSQGGYESEGTVFITAGGDMRGDFTSSVNGGAAVESHMIMQGNEAHVWSGSQGAKVNMGAMGASASSQAGQTVDLDAEVEYECNDWNRDNSKFTLPSNVEFIDVEAMMQGGMRY